MTSPLEYALSRVANDQCKVIPIATRPIDKILDGIAGPAIIRLPPFEPGEFNASRLIYGQTLHADYCHYNIPMNFADWIFWASVFLLVCSFIFSIV